jgi:hypothetical protein
VRSNEILFQNIKNRLEDEESYILFILLDGPFHALWIENMKTKSFV